MKYKLKDICLTVTDGSHFSPKAQDEGFPMFSVKDMLEYGFDYSNCKRISEEDFEKMRSSGCVPQEGDVLVAKDGSYLKEIFVCTETKDEAILSSIAIFRPNQEMVNPYYLCYLLKSPQIFNYISSNCVSGSALPRIVLKAFKEVEMDVPSMDIQLKVVNMLKFIDAKVQTNTAINRNLHDQINALYAKQFEPYIMSENPPVGWDCVKIGDVAEVKNGYAFKGIDFVEDGTVPVIKIKNVKPYKILLNTVDYVKEETVVGKDRFKISHGDILITMTGNRKDGSPDSWVGKVAVFDIFGDYYLNQRVGIIEPDTSKVSTYYLSEFLSSWTMQKYFIERATSSGGQANISPDLIKKIEFSIPPKPKMDEFEEMASEYYKAIAKLQDELNKLELLRDTLLPKLMSGEIDVSNLNI